MNSRSGNKALAERALTGFAAGAMIYVGVLLFAFGFTLMMALDVVLG